MYLGEQPAVGTFDLITLSQSFDGSRTAFTMSKSVGTANQLMIVLNGVTQHWGEAFTVSGTTLTFTSAPASGSAVKILDFGRHVLDVGTISGGSVTTAKLADDAITAAKLADDAVTAAKLADDAVTIAKLAATGTASSSTFLRGDNAWTAVNVPAVGEPYWSGKQASAQSIANGTYTKITGCTTTELDSATAFDGTRFTVPSGKAGIYLVLVGVGMDAGGISNDLSHFECRIQKNGSAHVHGKQQMTTSSSGSFAYYSCQLVGILNLAVGDYVEMYAYFGQLSGTPACNTHADLTQFAGCRIG